MILGPLLKYNKKSYPCESFLLYKDQASYFYGYLDELEPSDVYYDINFVIEDNTIKFLINGKMFIVGLNRVNTTLFWHKHNGKFKIEQIIFEFKRPKKHKLILLYGDFPIELVWILKDAELWTNESAFIKKQFHDYLNKERVLTLAKKLPKDMLQTIVEYM